MQRMTARKAVVYLFIWWMVIVWLSMTRIGLVSAAAPTGSVSAVTSTCPILAEATAPSHAALFAKTSFSNSESERASSGTVPSQAAPADATLLMFLGEDLDVVTVASRMPESPSSAPAVVQVVDRKTIQKYGYRTLAELLSAQPGFFMMEQGAGSLPYLRGIANAILVLYDGVPIPTNGNRSYYPLDDELSLLSVKQVEIIRGPGSVLWGADAFAGIVNIVPMTGKDVERSVVSVGAGDHGMLTGYAARGYSAPSGNWDAFFSIYGATKETRHDTYMDLTHPDGTGHVDASTYHEMLFNVDVADLFSLSGRFSDYSRPYTLTDHYNGTPFSWAGQKEAPVNFLKFNAARHAGASHWNLTAYYQDVRYNEQHHGLFVKETDAIEIEERFGIFYGELLWDRRLFEKGLLTTGLSWRTNRVEGALVDGGFVPELLLDDRTVQYIDQENYRYDTTSLFTQYRHPFSWGSFWAGFRWDDNSIYTDPALSCSVGLNVPIKGGWRIKTVLGTGYRTHYALQIPDNDSITLRVDEEDLQRDEVATLNLQAEWQGKKGDIFSATAFYSRLSDTVAYDPIAGVSSPADHRFSGLELSGRRRLSRSVDGYATLARIFSSGEAYRYSMVTSVNIRPGEPPIYNIESWSEPYDTGAKWSASAGIFWQMAPGVNLSLSGFWCSALGYIYEEGSISGEYHNPVLINARLNLDPLLQKEGISFTLGVDNLLDGTFHYPGYYGPIQGEPFSFYGQFTVEF